MFWLFSAAARRTRNNHNRRWIVCRRRLRARWPSSWIRSSRPRRKRTTKCRKRSKSRKTPKRSSRSWATSLAARSPNWRTRSARLRPPTQTIWPNRKPSKHSTITRWNIRNRNEPINNNINFDGKTIWYERFSITLLLICII